METKNLEDARQWIDLGTALHKLGRYQQAVENYDKALALEPKLAQVWCNRGIALEKLGRVQEAIESCQKALALS